MDRPRAADTPPSQVQILPAAWKDKASIAAMLDSYLRELGADTSYPYFEQYWSEPERHPFVSFAAARVAGFALVRSLDAPNKLEMAEFYVAPEFRRTGVGRKAAATLFHLLSGKWSIRVQCQNIGGRRFWSRVLPSHALPSSVEDAVVFSFQSSGQSPTAC